MVRRSIPPALLCLLMFFPSGCEYLQMTLARFKMDLGPFYQSKPRDIKEALPEECGFLMGEITGNPSLQAPLTVVALPEPYIRNMPSDCIVLSQPGPYLLYVPQGKYEIYAYADRDENGVCERAELVGRCERPRVVRVAAGEVITGLDLQVAETAPPGADVPVALEMPASPGKRLRGLKAGATIEFEDRIFAKEYATMGLWNPSEFIQHFGVNILAPEPFDPDKIPILFVHGSGGTPWDWEYFVQHLDRKRYQPWFFYYPSGLRLKTLSDLLYEEIKILCRRYPVEKMVLTAHSMGGLIARAYLKRCVADGRPCPVSLFVTLCAPWGGIERAKSAPENAPFKMPPVWQDLAPGSAFLRSLFEGGLPKGVQFCLFHASGTNRLLTLMKEEGDGVVSLESQLDGRARSESTCSFEFQESHQGILRSREVVERYMEALRSSLH